MFVIPTSSGLLRRLAEARISLRKDPPILPGESVWGGQAGVTAYGKIA
jgi:hypothetical protein